jgi:hypothetical protein
MLDMIAHTIIPLVGKMKQEESWFQTCLYVVTPYFIKGEKTAKKNRRRREREGKRKREGERKEGRKEGRKGGREGPEARYSSNPSIQVVEVGGSETQDLPWLHKFKANLG